MALALASESMYQQKTGCLPFCFASEVVIGLGIDGQAGRAEGGGVVACRHRTFIVALGLCCVSLMM